jgi:RNA polymerase primary sigma factor
MLKTEVEPPLSQPEDVLAVLVEKLVQDKPIAVTYAQIEAAIISVGLNPYNASDLYENVIENLERQSILVVETLEEDRNWIDEDFLAQESADEVVSLLKRVRISINEYNHPLLSAENEHKLIELYQDGKRANQEMSDEISEIQLISINKRIDIGNQALDEIMCCNLRLITRIAVRYARFTQHLTLDDLIQEGRIGLYKAINRFDLSANIRLSTYATWWIRQSIERAVADSDRTIRLPVHIQEDLRRLKRCSEQIFAVSGTEPTDKELSDAIGVPIKKICFLRTIDKQTFSLDVQIGRDGDGGAVLGDVIPDFNQYEPSRLIDERDLKLLIQDLLNQLNERERRVLSLRFGLCDGKELTLEAIGRIYGVTRERIRQIEIKALKRLRHPRMSRILRAFLV